MLNKINILAAFTLTSALIMSPSQAQDAGEGSDAKKQAGSPTTEQDPCTKIPQINFSDGEISFGGVVCPDLDVSDKQTGIPDDDNNKGSAENEAIKQAGPKL